MEYDAIITNAQFHPMVEIVNSELLLWAKIPSLKDEFGLQTERGSIENLRNKFGFLITGEAEYDLTPLIGRKCTVARITATPIFTIRFLRFNEF